MYVDCFPRVSRFYHVLRAKQCVFQYPPYTECKYGGPLCRRPGRVHESEASEASVFCFDSASPENSCFVDGLVCFILLCLLVFVFLNATRRDRNCPTFASKGKKWVHGIH